MAALVCDLCGGKLTMGSGAIAVCDKCGMEHSKERMQEKVQEIKGTVKIDNSHHIGNWMNMGKAAASSGNQAEAYEYFTKVVEIDPTNWRAIYEKGKAAAWQSTLANLRLTEFYHSIKKALPLIGESGLDESEIISIHNEFAVALFNVNNALTDLVQENLSKKDDLYFDIHWDEMYNTRQRTETNIIQIEDAMTLIEGYNDDLSKNNIIEMKKRICDDLRHVCGFYFFWLDYLQTSVSYFGYNAKEKIPFIEKYDRLLTNIQEADPNYGTSEYMLIDPFDVPKNTTQGLSRREEIKRNESKRSLEREKQQKIIKKNKYSEEHPDEMQKLKEKELVAANIEKDVKANEQKLEALENKKYDFEKIISDYENSIMQNRAIIDKQSKKFFGKKNALETISLCEIEIRNLEIKLSEKRADVNDLYTQINEQTDIVQRLKRNLADSESEIHAFYDSKGFEH